MAGLQVLTYVMVLCYAGILATRQTESGEPPKGLFPTVNNLATKAVITVNATCGERGPESYCKLVEHDVSMREPQCGVCDSNSQNPLERHSIVNAIDGTSRWWQSPTLQNGRRYQWVTITLDLRQVYQIAYIIIKSAISPRPGNWILEHSVDGINFQPWQYYAISDTECWQYYGIRPTTGQPRYRSDNEVICTSYYSKLNPLEDGEIHTSLVNGRPGAEGPSDTLREFTTARFIRIRLQKIRTLHADLMTLQTNDPRRIDKTVTRRYFYSIKDISVGGQCACNGHARDCLETSFDGKQQCKCEHNTCGENCNFCCPLFNQKPWRPGNSTHGAICEGCQCFGHSTKCHYDQDVADKRLSLNIDGVYEGGGVCENCEHNTAGINCEQCADGFYRPRKVRQDDPNPCIQCQCRGIGMTGLCVKDDSYLSERVEPGECLCKEGFTGQKCDQCAKGYRNYPICEPCPCHFAGTVDGTKCEGLCVCKANVEGDRCDKCKEGYYHLSADNPDGCSPCFCFGVTNRCTSTDWGKEIIKETDGWLVTSLNGSIVVSPKRYGNQFIIEDSYMHSLHNYYWLAPEDYIGQKLYSYGGELTFSFSYIVMRGDIYGEYTDKYPDIVLEGVNGDLFGYGWAKHPEEQTVTITAPLHEQGWFLLTKTGDRASPASRRTFTFALNNIKRLCLRAKFHDVQVECTLMDAILEIASNTSGSRSKMPSVEECVCPPGYTGLSCEVCSPGYRRLHVPFPEGGICEKCDCYNHAESCHPITGHCQVCLHNTEGAKCDRCLPGYYGDARIGTPEDCKRCACPLEDPRNNFSPTCRTKSTPSGRSDYVCLQCDHGYEGEKCERCSDGYFGSPLVLGGYCQPCECGRNVDRSHPGFCDRVTGQCLRCLGNTGGWHCQECLDGFYGNAAREECRPCNCDRYGSLHEENCDKITGQCHCRENYDGRRCEKCRQGYGNVMTGCEPCSCNRIGAYSEFCDPVSGHCVCKPGVFGTRCESCLESHYGFSEEGCRSCDCSSHGSLSLQCDEISGQCECKQHVLGRACDRCQPGYWNLQSNIGCERCVCNSSGIISPACDETTGQCVCKPGVGGRHCDQCLPGYFLFTSKGCHKCDPCDAPGHLCDPKTGRCVCPPYTTGDRCQFCTPDAYGYSSKTGCQPCNCSRSGSVNQQCDDVTGNCFCREGFEGRHCDRCIFGYYQFPHCQRCDCNLIGTNPDQCHIIQHDLTCQCDEKGQCPCKENVDGRNCDYCKENTFGLTANNSKGCFTCFCFGRTRNCNEASLSRSKLCIAEKKVKFEVGDDEISTIQAFKVIPGQSDSVVMRVLYDLDEPLYWTLPTEFLGDRVLAYNGFIEYDIAVHSNRPFPEALLHRFPSMVLQGNYRLVLIHSLHNKTRGRHIIRLHEDEWKYRENPQTPVTREAMMVALQNVQHILIRGTDSNDVKSASLSNICMEMAREQSFRSDAPSEGIEFCQCPPQYVGLSCQDPAPGYYRKRKVDFINSKNILDLVGWAEPCKCNNRSQTCDRETGRCINCTGNSSGENCEHCIRGFYEDQYSRRCLPCACPTIEQRFSDTCHPEGSDYICIDCDLGYTGRHCERCSDGYYGNPVEKDGTCEPCNCNPYGSLDQICNKKSGQCHCREGLISRDCSECQERHILTEYGCKSCVDDCTGALFDELDQIEHDLNCIDLSNVTAIPWVYLHLLQNQTKELKVPVDRMVETIPRGKDLIRDFEIRFELEKKAEDLLRKSTDTGSKGLRVAANAEKTVNQIKETLEKVQMLQKNISDLIKRLDQYGQDPSRPGSDINSLLREAEAILKELQGRDFTPNVKEAQAEIKLARDLLHKVKGLAFNRKHVDYLKERLETVEDVLISAISRIEEDVRKPVEQASYINHSTLGALNETMDTIDRTIKAADMASETISNASKILGEARSAVIDATLKDSDLQRLTQKLDKAANELETHNGILSRLNPLYKEDYVIPAQRHAEDLERKVNLYVRQFNVTRHVSEFPLKAAKAYQSIIDALDAAENAARDANNAAKVAYEKAYPTRGNQEPLIERARKSREYSLELLAEAKHLRDGKVPALDGLLREKQRIIENVGENLAQGRKNVAIIDRELAGLPSGVSDALNRANQRTVKAVTATDFAMQKVDTVKDKIKKDLLPKLDELRSRTTAGLENFTKIIEKARKDIGSASDKATSAEGAAFRVREIHLRNEANLTELRNKILLARQTASNIRVSITGDNKGLCKRSYTPEIEPTTTNTIVLYYAIKSEARDSLLFFLGSSKDDDFMAIEMVNRKIRFIWNAGGGTQLIEHSLTIETNDQKFVKNEQWYKIEVQRFGNNAVLSVKRTPDGHKADPHEVTGASPIGFSKMDLDSSSYFYIGGLPSGYKPPKELKSTYLAGCLYEVYLDDKRVGLWNFQTNQGCDGCKEGAKEDIDINSYRFKGDGYAILPQIKRYNKETYDVSLWFKTFDENALLFMAPSLHNDDFVSLEIKEGRVVYHVNLGGSSQFTISSTAKYNNGKWTKVNAVRGGLLGQLQVDDEVLMHEMKAGSTSLDIEDSELYCGGVPPNFTKSRWPGITFQNFLGCMKGVQIDATPVDLLKNAYGVERGCAERVTKVAAFDGAGYLELKGQPLPHEASFGFSFLTRQADALLLLSTFKGTEASLEKANHYYSVAIVNGQLEVRVNSGSDEDYQMSSDVVVNDGKYHAVTVTKKNRKIVMRIDDKEVAQFRLRRGEREIAAPKDGGLYFGGLPQHIALGQEASTRTGFVGIIKDAIFNNRLLRFNKPVQFVGVGIGRTTMLDKGAELVHTPMSDLVETCAPTFPLKVEKRAINFGINRDSFVKISVGKRELTSNLKMGFDFRTHETTGLFLVSQHGRRKNYFALILENGHLVANIQVKRMSVKIVSPAPVSDGKWHSVSITFYKQVMYMTIDGNITEGEVKVKKLPLRSLIYIGGIPRNFAPNKKLIKEKFQGCVKNLIIAGKQRTLMEDPIHGITPCILDVEPGFYFSNGAHAVLSSPLLFKRRLNVHLEFRTNQLNGIIMTITAGIHTLAISTEDNKVELNTSADDSSEPLALVHEFHSKYSICKNDWHAIDINYSSGTINFKVNDFKAIEAKVKWLQRSNDKAKIYVGGHPDDSSLDFTGCIKNITLNRAPFSWSEASVHNVKPCPAA